MRRHAVEQVAARSGVATLYGRLATSTQPARRRAARPSRAHGVGLDHAHAGRSATTSRSTGARPRSTSTAVTVGAGLGQRQRQRAQPGADLDHAIAGTDAGQAGDAAHRVRVGHEVLAERAPGGQAVGRQQVAHRRPRMGHEDWRISTWIGAEVRSAICWNLVSRMTSVSWSPPGQIRVVHRIERPLATLTTVTTCPPDMPL